MTPYAEITYEVAGRIATVTLNRPRARGGYTVRMSDELSHAMDTADRDEDVRVVVLTGSGKDFSVGADLSAGGFDFDHGDGPPDGWQEPAGRCSKRIFTMNKPVIAALRGASVGGGLTLDKAYELARDLVANTAPVSVAVTRQLLYRMASAPYLPWLAQ